MESLHYMYVLVCALTSFLPCVCVVDADEIRRLSRSFRRLDLNQNGALDVDEFLQIPELQQNPLVRRVIEIFDEDGNGEVDFKGEKCRWHVRLYCCAVRLYCCAVRLYCCAVRLYCCAVRLYCCAVRLYCCAVSCTVVL